MEFTNDVGNSEFRKTDKRTFSVFSGGNDKLLVRHGTWNEHKQSSSCRDIFYNIQDRGSTDFQRPSGAEIHGPKPVGPGPSGSVLVLGPYWTRAGKILEI